MLGKRSPQRGLYEADRLYLDFVGEQTFYGFLARERDKLFEDEDFAGLYCRDNGRDSVPPSLLATALLLQAHDRVSDAEAKPVTNQPPIRIRSCTLARGRPDSGDADESDKYSPERV